MGLFSKKKGSVSPTTIHNIDFYNTNGETSWEFEGFIPEINNQQLNWLFPKGEPVDGTETNTKSLFLIYREVKQVIQTISGCFNYEGFPDYFPLDKFEEKLIRDGSVALFMHSGTLYCAGFTVNKKDLYDNPTEIEINEKDTNFDKMKPDEFVIFYSDSTRDGVYQALAMDLTSKVDVMTQLYYNLFDSRDHVFMVSDKPQKTINTLLSRLRFGKSAYLGYQVGDTFNSGDITEALANTKAVYGQQTAVKNLFETVSLTDRAESLTNQYIFWENRIKEYCGLNINMVSNATRAIQGEIAQQQGRNEINLEDRLNQRKKGLETASKKWNLTLTVEKNEFINQMVEGLKNNADTGDGGNKNEN